MEQIHGLLVVKLLLLLAAANGTPVLTRWFVKDWANASLDGSRLADGRPLFGPSKTIRGLVCAIAAQLLSRRCSVFRRSSALLSVQPQCWATLYPVLLSVAWDFPPVPWRLGWIKFQNRFFR